MSSGFPEPTIIPPRSHHTHTIILLHGRGGDSRDFGSELVTTLLLDSNPRLNTLPKSFPSLKFVFPCAKHLPAIGLRGRLVPQWFDRLALDPKYECKEVELPGLRDTARYVHALIEAEAELVGGLKNVIVGGFSQGAAASLFALLSYGRGSLGGFMGISGWLPLRSELDAQLLSPALAVESAASDSNHYGSGNDYLEQPLGAPPDPDRQKRFGLPAVRHLRENICGFPPVDPPESADSVYCLKTPIWLAHGAQDQKVSVNLGRSAALTAQKLGCDVMWMKYDDLGHWLTPEQLVDMVVFLSARVGVPEAE